MTLHKRPMCATAETETDSGRIYRNLSSYSKEFIIVRNTSRHTRASIRTKGVMSRILDQMPDPGLEI